MTCSDTELTADFFPETHDPSGALQGPWRILVQLPAGISIAVDESGFPITLDPTGADGDTLVISLVSVALQTDQTVPNVWAIVFYTQNGSPKEVGYRIRGRYVLNTTPVTGRDRTMLLLCGQT